MINARHNGTVKGSYQINRRNKLVTLRDENGVNKITENKARKIRHKCINSGFAVWSASDKVEHYIKPQTAPDDHEIKPACEIEIFDFNNECSLIVRLAVRSSVYLQSQTVTISLSRMHLYGPALHSLGFYPVKLSGIGSAKKGSYKLFRSNLDLFPNLSKEMAEKLFYCVD